MCPCLVMMIQDQKERAMAKNNDNDTEVDDWKSRYIEVTYGSKLLNY